MLFHPGQHPPASDDGQDPKRRRIARACDMCRKKKVQMHVGHIRCKLQLLIMCNIDKMRWEVTSMYTLCQLQYRMCLYIGGEEAKSS